MNRNKIFIITGALFFAFFIALLSWLQTMKRQPNDLKNKYEIEILIKDGKYRFDLISFHNHMDGWIDITVFNNSMSKEDLEKRNIFKKDNTLKNMFKFFDKIPTYFNNVNKSLSESIVSTVKKGDGW